MGLKFALKTEYKKILADTLTPVSAYLKLRDVFPHSLLLESSDYHANNNDFLWPEGSYRINTARWMDSNLGFNSPDRPVQLEVFTGEKIEMHVIHYRTEDEIKNDSTILEAPLYKAFHESPFNDVSIIDRETGRYLDAMDKTHEAFTAFRKSFDANEQRLFEEWKKEKSEGVSESENTNFDQNNKQLTIYLNSGLEDSLGELVIPSTLLNGELKF